MRALAAAACLAALMIPGVAGAAEPPSLDVQLVAARTGPKADVVLVLMVTGNGLDPSALPADADRCDGTGYARTDDPQETGCYRITATENGKPIGKLSYDLMVNHGSTAYLLLSYRTPADPKSARALRLDLSFKLWDDVVRNRAPETAIDLAQAPGFDDPDNPWAPLYAFQDRRLNEAYDALTAKVAAGQARELLVQAERDWIALKDADCKAPLEATPAAEDWCRTLRTMDRTDQLEAYRRGLAGATP
ncbi:lysozyme inhibitor LprI family protein [Inquilinus sp.]|uniref:lysozyme inhibitor LprI family protein n=1 Tax=Inquilinus sp. TaxID=1932117 RepID=UPI0031DB81FB